MKTILLLLMLFALPSFSLQDSPCGGNERWDVKTLTDAGASKINFTPDTIAIDSLRKIMPGQKIGNTLPRFGIEFKTYVVKCNIREYRVEDDGDYHLVLVSLTDTTKTMIGEIPNSFCSSVFASPYASKFAETKTYFEQNIILKRNKTKRGVYLIYGIFFYDKIHGQLGVAPNGCELHPILSIKKIS
jgi:hypothetical protein